MLVFWENGEDLNGGIAMEKLFVVPLKMGKMFLRGEGKEETGRIILPPGGSITTDTYFGCFPCEPYVDNTDIRSIQAVAEVKGKGTVELCYYSAEEEKILCDYHFDSASFERVSLSTQISDQSSGILYFKVTAENAVEVRNIWYEGAGETKPTNVAVIICTYKREEYALRNLKILSEYAGSDLSIICVDNGSTLKADSTHTLDKVSIISNRNYGGSGGYARGMIEAGKISGCTHFWLMDDDIQFEPEIIGRAVSFLKYRKLDDIRLAAGMFSFETPTTQNEATAVFDGFTFHSNAGNLDFSFKENLLKNKIDNVDNTYGGWWSLVIPATEELPMPFFIKLDDIEHGIRCKGRYVIMDGFGVWHEAFDKKGNAWSEYYTTRNTLITQTLYPELSNSHYKMMGIRLLKALAYNEPKCMEAVCQGVEDYSAGAGQFKKANPEKRHKEVMEKYMAPLASDISRKKMLGRAAVNVLKPKNWQSIGLFFKAVNMLKKSGKDGGWKEMGTRAFWEEYLSLTG